MRPGTGTNAGSPRWAARPSSDDDTRLMRRMSKGVPLLSRCRHDDPGRAGARRFNPKFPGRSRPMAQVTPCVRIMESLLQNAGVPQPEIDPLINDLKTGAATETDTMNKMGRR